eukprot:6187169-Pleurochrysis_carterae.AAC.7
MQTDSSIRRVRKIWHPSGVLTCSVARRVVMCTAHSSHRHTSSVSVSTLPLTVTPTRVQPSTESFTTASDAGSTM